MDKNEFKKILFKVAFCAMACDGHIDEREIEELRIMDKNTTYFSDVDCSNYLNILINDFSNKGAKVIDELFELLRNTKLNPIQELLILEVALRIINADEKIDENEVKFINFLRSKLELYDETIVDRFGKLKILYTNEYLSEPLKESEKKFINSITIPEMEHLEDIDFKNSKKR